MSCEWAVPHAVCRDCYEMLGAASASCPMCGSGRLVAHAEIDVLGIAHIDCDAFYASVEKRDDPTLEDRPLIVGHAGGRGVVTTACYLARISGVRSAMPMFQALELCPDAVVLPPDMAKYKRVSEAIRLCPGVLRTSTSVFLRQVIPYRITQMLDAPPVP